MNCWQDSQKRRWVSRLKLNVSIGAVIRAPTLRAFPLITELSNIPRISELEEFWDSEMAKPARKVLKVGKNGTLQANKEFRRHVESNSPSRTSYYWILIVNGHSMKLNEITRRFSQLNHPIKWRISTHSLLSYFRMFDYLCLK